MYFQELESKITEKQVKEQWEVQIYVVFFFLTSLLVVSYSQENASPFWKESKIKFVLSIAVPVPNRQLPPPRSSVNDFIPALSRVELHNAVNDWNKSAYQFSPLPQSSVPSSQGGLDYSLHINSRAPIYFLFF